MSSIENAGRPSAHGTTLSVAEKLGLAMQVIFRRGCYLDYPLASIKAWLYPAAQLQQLHIFIGKDRRLLGYMTWAWFDVETEARWRRGQIGMLHISEWNEGDRLWILDLVAMPGNGRLCAWLASSLFPEGTVAHALPRRAVTPSETIIRWTSHFHPNRFAYRKRIRMTSADTG
jgi:hemolysin-activating ACP:hemolysin acyltransferase